jgi:hypothetical protein
MQPIDARRMFPGFDEPGFKTPFSVTVTAPTGSKVFANAPVEGATPSGAMTVHRFAATQPLPTYLVALGVGPFDVVEGSVPPNGVRKNPLPFRVIATKGQTPRMQLASVETPKLVLLLEDYLGIAYPFEKLDLLASPLLGGGMENAGLIVQDDALMLLDADAPLPQLRAFAQVTAHEIAHQWFGDLVTPVWWTDIWLNESFASWLGNKISDRWRPELGIATGGLEGAFRAMNTDSLGEGRPLRQPIEENRQISSAFDVITYQKGAQVLSMFESFLGPEKFANGVQTHLQRFRSSNATADDFFRSLGDASGDPRVVAAMQTFTDQTGVPVVTVATTANGLTLSQARYRPLGVAARPAQTWIIPLCLAEGSRQSCTLLDKAESAMAIAPSGPLMPNANGAGYYRFRLDNTGWDRLIAAAGTLSGRDALALADSLWADFAAGTGSLQRVITAAQSLRDHPERQAALTLGFRLQQLGRSVLTSDQVANYQKLMRSIFASRLTALGFDPRRGAYAHEPAARQSLRESLVPLVALDGRALDVRKNLLTAAVRYLDGDVPALDPAFRNVALGVAVQSLGAPFMTKLRDAMIKSSDPLFRQHAGEALASADTPELADVAVSLAFSPGMQPLESALLLFGLSAQPGARETLVAFLDRNFTRVVESLPSFARPQLISVVGNYCEASDVERVGAYFKPKLEALGGGELELKQTEEGIRQCAALKDKKGGEIDAVLQMASNVE